MSTVKVTDESFEKDVLQADRSVRASPGTVCSALCLKARANPCATP